MKAIETEYKDVEFRSRLEARWAVFFDEIGIPWLYEPEGYELPGGRYLPDFYLPTLATFVEIKPEEPTLEERRKCGWLAAGSSKRVVLFPYAPGGWVGNVHTNSEVFTPVSVHDDEHYDTDVNHVFCLCPVCGKVGIEFRGFGGRICGNDCAAEEKTYTAEYARVVDAARKANGYRFWSPKEAA